MPAQRLLLTLFALVALAVLLNGAPFWLKRVGWTEVPSCPDCERHLRALEALDADQLSPAEQLDYWRARRYWERQAWYRLAGSEPYLKAAKDLVVVLLLLVALAWRPGGTVPQVGVALPALLVLVCFGLLVALYQFGWPAAVSGLRSFYFLPVMLLAGWMATDENLALLAKVLAWLLGLQVPMVIIELSAADELFAGSVLGMLRWGRVVGSLLQPASLGIFAVVTLALYGCFVNRRSPGFGLLLFATGVLVLVSGSGTALILCTLVAGALLLGDATPARWQKLMLVVAGCAVALALPLLTGRDDITVSASIRLDRFASLLVSASAYWQLLFGHGLGIGTNTLIQLSQFMQLPLPVGVVPGAALVSVGSTPVSLVAQIGVVGCGLFYLLLAQSVSRDRGGRLALLAIAGASLTVNVLELFPVNLLLGLLLARGLAGPLEKAHGPAGPVAKGSLA